MKDSQRHGKKQDPKITKVFFCVFFSPRLHQTKPTHTKPPAPAERINRLAWIPSLRLPRHPPLPASLQTQSVSQSVPGGDRTILWNPELGLYSYCVNHGTTGTMLSRARLLWGPWAWTLSSIMALQEKRERNDGR